LGGGLSAVEQLEPLQPPVEGCPTNAEIARSGRHVAVGSGERMVLMDLIGDILDPACSMS
jgi:hypothetical protein